MTNTNDVMKANDGPWQWVDKGGYWALVNCNGQQVLDDGSACGEYNREIEPDSEHGRMVQDAPAAKLALELICAGVAKVENGSFWFGQSRNADFTMVYISGPWTDVINAIGWSRCLQALAAARGARSADDTAETGIIAGTNRTTGGWIGQP